MNNNRRNTRTRDALRCIAIMIAAFYTSLISGCANSPQTFFAPKTTPTAAVTQAVVLSTNPAGNGSTLHINVSDDSTAGALVTGPNPVFLGKAFGLPFVINSDNSVTLYTTLASQYTVSSQSTLVTTGLPSSTSGAVAGAAGSNGIYTPDSGSNDVNFLSSSVHAAAQTVPVGSRPVAAAFSAQAGKIYVVNHDDNTVSVMSTRDNAILTTLAVGAQPIWAVASADGMVVYVVNQGDGTVSAIDTSRDQVIATVGVASAVPSPNFAFFDPKRQRLYVANTGQNTISVIDGSGVNLNVTPPIAPTHLADITLSGAPVSLVALADGSRVYAALGGCPPGINHTSLLANLASCNGNRVSVIDAAGLSETKTITVGAGAVSIDAAADGSRVYVANANDASISIIKTATDTEASRVPAPLQSLNCSNPAACPATAKQTPFMVRVVP